MIWTTYKMKHWPMAFKSEVSLNFWSDRPYIRASLTITLILNYLSYLSRKIMSIKVGYYSRKKSLVTIQLQSDRMSVFLSKRPYICPSLRLSFCNMYELLLTYCYSTKNLRNHTFVCLFKRIFVVKYKRFNCRISGRIVSISGIRPNPSYF